LINIGQLIAELLAVSTLVFGTIAVWILMGYYSIRILRSFKGGLLSNGWKYICIAVPFLIFGQLATSMSGSTSISLNLEQSLKVLGASFSLLGGIMIVVGFRAQYSLWNPKGMKHASTSAEDEPVSQQAVAKTA